MLGPLFRSGGAKPHLFATPEEKKQVEVFLSDIPNQLQTKPQEDVKIHLYDISLHGRIYARDAAFISQDSIHFLQKRFIDMGFAVLLKEKYDSSWAYFCYCKAPQRYTLKVSVPLEEEERTGSLVPVSVNPEEELPLINADISTLRQRKQEFFRQKAIEHQQFEESWKAFLKVEQEKFASNVRDKIRSFPSDVRKFEIPIPKIGTGLRGATDVSTPIAKELTATGKWDVSFKEANEYSSLKLEKMILALTRKG